MNNKLRAAIAAISLGLLTVTGCAQTAPTAPGDSPGSSEAPAGGDASLTTAETSFGQVVVDDRGMTVYVFDNDTVDSGTSSCTGDCLVTWPPVLTTSETPEVTGITGIVSTIAGPDEGNQITINGLPLYYYAADTTPGDAKGQGFGGIWWVVGPNGDKISDAAGGRSGY